MAEALWEKAAEMLRGLHCPFEQDAPMCRYTTFKIGGPADLLAAPENEEQFSAVLRFCDAACMPVTVIGNGSNLLVADRGIRGMVLRTTGMKTVRRDGNALVCGAGAMLSRVSTEAQRAGLAGLAFAHGIPGTVGGAVRMNAGAYGGETGPLVESCGIVFENGEAAVLSGKEMGFSYRHSILEDTGAFCTSVRFALTPGDADALRAEAEDYDRRRREKQPLDMPSAGSTFKRPEGLFAGKLIEDCGLKGFAVGGAMVSEKHAGFVVNTGGATADDVRRLIEQIQNRVRQEYGVTLEPEIRMLGDF